MGDVNLQEVEIPPFNGLLFHLYDEVNINFEVIFFHQHLIAQPFPSCHPLHSHLLSWFSSLVILSVMFA